VLRLLDTYGNTNSNTDRHNDGERSCCSPQAVVSARALSHSLGLPHFTLDLEDLVAVSWVVKGKKVAPWCRFLVAPASREVMEDAMNMGVIQTILSAGGTILPPGCGPCLGAHGGVLAPGEVCISSSNRNFKGRMGSDEAEVYVASPATVAASAVAGEIADPREVLTFEL
jgi:aconitase A